MNFSAIKQNLKQMVPSVLEAISIPGMFANFQSELDALAANFNQSDSPVIISLGKMADTMAWEFVQRAGITNCRGVVCSPYPSQIEPVKGLDYFSGGHPVPNQASLSAAQQTLELLTSLAEADTVVYLISGGASAAFELPVAGIGLETLQTTYQTLVTCGAGIEEINTVRKYLSTVKAGRLAVAAAPARQVTFAVSDVPSEAIGWISSGPSIHDETTAADLMQVLDHHQLHQQLPPAVVNVLQTPDETPKQDWPAFARSQWHCIGSNQKAMAAAQEFAQQQGWHCQIITEHDEVDVQEAASELVKRLSDFSNHPQPVCLIAGGEVRSPVRGNGRGGRNQAFALECVPLIANRPMAVISFGTDGIDGNSTAAGAIATGESLAHCQRLGLDIDSIRADSNSNHLFEQLNDLIITGPTQNNVRDVRALVTW